MLRTLFLLIFTTVTAISCGNVRIYDLKSCGEFTFKSLAVTGCNEHVCYISNGKPYVLNVTFVANQNTKTFRGVTWTFDYGTVGVVGGSYDTDGCANNEYIWLDGDRCPLRKGRTYSLIINWIPDGLTVGTQPVFIGRYYGDGKECKDLLYGLTKHTVV